MDLFFGASVSPGIGRGNAFVIPDQAQRVIPQTPITAEQVDSEWLRYVYARDSVAEQIKIQLEQIQGNKEIFETYSLMLADPVFNKEVGDCIAERLFNVEFILDFKMEEYAQRLRDSGNDYLADRAQDIIDIFGRVLNELLNIHPFDMEQVPEGVVLIAQSLNASDAMVISKKRLSGLALVEGGLSSHVAILARSYGVPAVFALPKEIKKIHNSERIILDADSAELIVDPDAGTVHLVSIPRDTMITLNGNTEKINAAFAYGGAASAVNAVSKLAGVPITHFVEVGFEGVIDVVDYVGGVWVNVPEPFSGGGYYFDAGEQLLNGEQALAYARQRYAFTGGDFTRSQSQRQIVQGIIDKVLAAPPTELPGLVSVLARMISTDMSAGDIASLALKFRENGVKIYSTVAPSYTLWEGDISYVGTMYNEWAELMKRVDAGMDPASTDPIPEPQASSETLGAATNGAAPRDYYDLVDEAGLTTDDIDTPQ